MKIAVPTETQAGEQRVAASPDTVKAYVKKGLEVVVQQGAGAGGSPGPPLLRIRLQCRRKQLGLRVVQVRRGDHDVGFGEALGAVAITPVDAVHGTRLARRVLERLTRSAVGNDAFPFGQARVLQLAGAPVTASPT